MRILNIGSINIDYVYQTPHFVSGGETLEATHRSVFMGGKGLNQTVAIARSGLDVSHAGVLGADGQFLYDFLKTSKVNIDHVRIDPSFASGHTFIQVTPDAENAILYFPGTNHQVTQNLVCEALESLSANDLVLFQNEVNDIDRILIEAKKRNLLTIFNPAPFDANVCNYPLECVDVLILNRTEAQGMLGQNLLDTQSALKALQEKLPNAVIILTLGAKGIVYALPHEAPRTIDSYCVKAVDTTGAGDTFVGYAMHAICSWFEAHDAQTFHALLDTAVLAAAISVTRAGAVASIPTMEEVQQFRKSLT